MTRDPPNYILAEFQADDHDRYQRIYDTYERFDGGWKDVIEKGTEVIDSELEQTNSHS